MPLVILIIGIVVVGGAIQIVQLYWMYLLAGVAIAAIIFAIHKSRQSAEAARQEDEDRRIAYERELARQREVQRALEEQLKRNCETAIATYESIPKHLLTAEELLDSAEVDFKAHVYAPFWDSVERAVSKIAQANWDINNIKTTAQEYSGNLKQLKKPFAPFPISKNAVEKLDTVRATERRLNAIVRRAHADDKFAIIFEQRRTSAILIAGFANLSAALYDVGDMIASSIEGLRSEVADMARDARVHHDNVQRELTQIVLSVSEIDRGISHLNESARGMAVQNASRQEKAIVMLDNIQHRRKPRV